MYELQLMLILSKLQVNVENMQDLCPLMLAIWRLLSAGMKQHAPTLTFINASEKHTGSVLMVEEVED